MLSCSNGSYMMYPMMSFSRNLTYQLLLSVVMLPLFVTCSKSSMACAHLPTPTDPISVPVCVTKIPVLLTPPFCRLFQSHLFTHTLPPSGITCPKPLLSPLPSKPSNRLSTPTLTSFECLFPATLFCFFCLFGMFLYFFVHFFPLVFGFDVFFRQSFNLLLTQYWIRLACRRML